MRRARPQGLALGAAEGRAVPAVAAAAQGARARPPSLDPGGLLTIPGEAGPRRGPGFAIPHTRVQPGETTFSPFPTLVFRGRGGPRPSLRPDVPAEPRGLVAAGRVAPRPLTYPEGSTVARA